MPYKSVSELPSNVPAAHAKQFLEVFNSAWKAAKDDKKSDAQAEETSFAQAWGVITKAGAKPKDRDVSQDGPGFGPVEKGSEDGGQVSDPQMSLRALEEEVAAAFITLRFAADQPRDPDGKFAAGSTGEDAHDTEGHLKAAADHTTLAKQEMARGDKEHSKMHEAAAHDHLKAAFAPAESKEAVGSIARVSSHTANTFPAEKQGRSDPSQILETREKYMSIERRFCAELRVGAALGGNSGGEEMSLVGYAARFNTESRDLGGFKETIAPGAFSRALSEKADVLCLFNHGVKSDVVLGRTTSGTLTLTQDDKGLSFRCQLDPNQQSHRDLHASVKRGDVGECSFAFTPNGENGDHWEDRKDDKGNWYISRTLQDVNLFDVSAVSHPAYYGTNVNARNEAVTPEIRSIVSAMVEKRAKKSVEKRDESVQDMLSCISKCLLEKFPADPLPNGQPCCSYGKYWICDTYEDYVIACTEGPTPSEYVKIPFVENPDADGYIFGEPQSVEKEWVPSDRAKSVDAEMRAFKASHMKAIADQHTADAAAASATSDVQRHEADEAAATAAAHTAAAASAQEEADRMEKCCMTRGDCSIKGCRCQNVMVAARDMDDDYDDDWDENDHTDEENEAHAAGKGERLLARKSVENRAAGDSKVRTKTVDGKQLSAGAFAFVGDPNDTSTWKYPIMDADHARNALARWGQHKGIPSDKEAGVYAKIVAKAKSFGIDVAETDASKAARSVSERVTAEAKAAKAAQPMSREEITDMELRFKLALLSTEVKG